jgi:putative PIN family toxin of toxin-antitoxin system
MRIVLDTNVIIDMLHFADAGTLPLSAALANKRVVCWSDCECLAELRRVLAYPQFALASAAQDALFTTYADLARRCDASGAENYALPRCRDGDDQKFLTLAARCGADLLVTRDRELLRLKKFKLGAQTCRIVNTADALALIDAAAKNPA